ncbi:Rho family-interacting cell polarization regulator 1 [Galemys pyrenaicus]|uniref:Rho family-interacting cell polarization regulator 1 n=1 Tax=Galemys pyrenaicus TaxID=202257 RepID=A0A8J6ANP9_GALPY|nr:Rho family-interacting cell polarization regulator 1 [Galemys pyrenaicus]
MRILSAETAHRPRVLQGPPLPATSWWPPRVTGLPRYPRGRSELWTPPGVPEPRERRGGARRVGGGAGLRGDGAEGGAGAGGGGGDSSSCGATRPGSERRAHGEREVPSPSAAIVKDAASLHKSRCLRACGARRCLFTSHGLAPEAHAPGLEGSPARTHSMMSLSVRPQRRLLSARVSRSQSFAGVLGSHERGPRSFPAFSPPGPPRKPPTLSRVSRMFSVAHPASKVPQPERLDLVYTALKRGLTAYLEVHQQEQEKLQGQIRESKRNSRLGFLYDLDKQVKSIERFLRRLEFHASKVRVRQARVHLKWAGLPQEIDELYEAYCVQRRLRDGAYNMVRAYSTGSPGSREARDSLAEATRGHREYTESMCLLESELEAQLGEFHLRMKGLAGFARLCVGDQYEICMKYGRQRWKLRGRIEGSGKQVWDSEETVFLPLLTEFLSIKVTELKGLANHVVVGSVSCETKDLFAALPQVVAVDINDLGTVKLSLEVTWSPFDKDDQPSATSTVNKASTVTKRFSTYSQSPPDTPSLREQAFYNMLRRQEDLENGTAWSLSSESSDDSSSPQLSGTARHSSAPRPLVQQPEPLPIQVAFRRPETPTSGPMDEEGAKAPSLANGHAPYSRTLSHISEASVDAALAEASVEAVGLESLARSSNSPAHPDPTHGKHSSPVPPNLDPDPSATSHTLSTTAPPDVAADPAPPAHTDSVHKDTDSSGSKLPAPTSTTDPTDGAHSDLSLTKVAQAQVQRAAGGTGDRRLEEALGALMAALDDYRGQFPELQGLEQEVTRLESLLMKQGLTRSRASSLSITVEHALESFSFLHEDEDEDNDGPRDSTECPALDAALVQHLYHCSRLLLKLGTFGPLRCQEAWALERLLREARVLEAICELSRRWDTPATSAQEVVQFSASRPGFLTFWDQCTEGLGPFICPVERVLLTFCSQYGARLSLRQPGLAEAVCVKFLEDALGQKLPRRSQPGPGEQLTIFQFWSHVEALDSPSMEAYVTESAEEVLLVRNLNSDDQAVVLKALRLAPEGRLRRDGLRALSSLLVHGNNKVMAAVSTQLRSLSLGPAFRERALLCFLDQLEDEDVQIRVAGCLALGCIKASEAIEPLVYLCQTDTEAVREAARQSLQQCGEEGQSAHRRLEESLDALPRIFGPGSMASTAF